MIEQGQIRVLIADDHPLSRRGLKALLEDDPSIIVVAECRNGVEAVHRYRELRPDVAVLDMRMPDLDGVGAISAIVNPANLPKLQVCALEEVDKLLRDGVTAEELDKAREGYLQAMKVGRSSDGALAGSLNGLRYLDRTMLWDAELEKKISELKPEQVGAALRRHIDPKKLVIVNAGDFGEEKKPTTVQ